MERGGALPRVRPGWEKAPELEVDGLPKQLPILQYQSSAQGSLTELELGW